MRRDQLEHLIRATCDLLGVDEVVVIGSQAILASYPDEGLPAPATRSLEADMLPADDPDEAKADLIDGVLGNGSMFEETHGIHADGVGESTALLAEGWRDRLVPLRNENTSGKTGWCLDPHDLVAAKMLAGRTKDLDFCGSLVEGNVIDPEVVIERLAATEVDRARRTRAMAQMRALADASE